MDRHPGSTQPGFTIAICAYNAVSRLGPTLDALTLLRYEGPWEVVVVDNASTDETAAFAQRWRDRLPGLRVVAEPQQGLAYARQCALREARHEYLCFTDDDNILARDYLQQAAWVLAKHPDIGALGGRSELIGVQAPRWFDAVARKYAVGRQYDQDGFIPRDRSLWGAGLIVRRAALEQLRALGFRPLLAGRAGAVQLAGDDAELCHALQLTGWRCYYDSLLTLGHAISAHRLDERVVHRMSYGFGVSTPVLETYRSLLQAGWRRRLKQSDVLYALMLAVRSARSAVKLAGQANIEARCELSLLRGAWRGLLDRRMRPSRVLREPFLRAVRTPRPAHTT